MTIPLSAWIGIALFLAANAGPWILVARTHASRNRTTIRERDKDIR